MGLANIIGGLISTIIIAGFLVLWVTLCLGALILLILVIASSVMSLYIWIMRNIFKRPSPVSQKTEKWANETLRDLRKLSIVEQLKDLPREYKEYDAQKKRKQK